MKSTLLIGDYLFVSQLSTSQANGPPPGGPDCYDLAALNVNTT
jgi:hypothetical protein